MKKKNIAVLAAIALMFGTPALAADMAVKAPPPPPAPVYNWTGWYVGGNVGYGWGNANTDLTENGSGTSCLGNCFSPIGGGPPPPLALPLPVQIRTDWTG